MFEKLRGVLDRLDGIDRSLCEPQTLADQEKYKSLMREAGQLRPVAEKYREYQRAQKDLDETKALMSESGLDRELREMAQEELERARAEMERIGGELKLLLLPKDPNDERSVVVEIRAGAGGEEAALFAGTLCRMYGMYAEARGWKTEVLSENTTELGGCREIVFLVEGEGAYSRLKFESGVHRVQRVPETESQGRIHTSTVTVAVLPEAQEVEFELNPADLQIDVFRSSGAGGQKVNKTSSAIRVTHLPTGMVVECQDERSQYKNKDKALRVLRSRLLETERRKQTEELAGQRRSQVGTGDRSERIRTYNFPQGRVSDHRIGLTLYKLEAILNGALDELIDALSMAAASAAQASHTLQNETDLRNHANIGSKSDR